MFILRLSAKVEEKKQMAVFILHLFMWLSHTRSSSHAKKESWLSPLTQSSVFIYCFLGGILVCREYMCSHWHYKQQIQPQTKMSLMFLMVESEQKT